MAAIGGGYDGVGPDSGVVQPCSWSGFGRGSEGVRMVCLIPKVVAGFVGFEGGGGSAVVGDGGADLGRFRRRSSDRNVCGCVVAVWRRCGKSLGTIGGRLRFSGDTGGGGTVVAGGDWGGRRWFQVNERYLRERKSSTGERSERDFPREREKYLY